MTSITLYTFISLFFWAIIGMIVNMLISASNRNIHSKKSPLEFSWKFFIKDNYKRFLISTFLVAIGVVFSQEIFGIETSPFAAFVAGLSMNKIVEKIKDLRR